jgi:hypothetical protein
LAGSIGIGSMATAIALADGAPARAAWGLWVVVGARSLAAIPYVRSQILRTRSHAGPTWHSDLAQVSAVVVAGVGWRVDLIPFAAWMAIVVLAVFDLAAVRMPPRPAVAIGIQQTIVGLGVIVATAVSIQLA